VGEADGEPRLIGQSLMDVRWAFAQVLGEELVRRAIASLPPDVSDAYVHATAVSWVPYSVVTAAHEAIARESGLGLEQLYERAVPLAVERSFGSVWRIFLRFTSDAALIARTPIMYAKSRSRGTMTSTLVAPGEAVVEVADFPEIPERDILALAISIRSLLSVAGRQSVTCDGERNRAGARWRLRWKK
jgi:hypothetical protein